MKRILLLVLAAALTLSCLPSCPARAEEPRPVLTIGDLTDRSAPRVDGDEQVAFWRYLENMIGMDIQFVHLTEDDYATGLSSGDLPDIVATQNSLATITDNGVAFNAAPYLEEYVPNLLQGAARTAYDVFVSLYGADKEFYFFPRQIGYNGVGYSNAPANRGYVVRWDYYRELGYPPINNEDDYLRVLRQMHENHPCTEDGYPTYLFGTNNFKGYATAFRAEVSLDYWAAYKYQNNIFTNEVYDGYTDTEHSVWWSLMAWLNKLYRAGREDGSFDLELLTQTEEQYQMKCTRGQYLGLQNTSTGLYDEKVKTDPDTLCGYGMVPTAATNLYTNVCQLLGNGSAYMWFISASSPHKEAALKLFNFMCDPSFLRDVAMGEEGVTWKHDENGVPVMTEFGRKQLDAYRAGNAPQDNYYVQWGTFSDLTSAWPLLRNNVIHPDGYPLDFESISREYAIASMTNNISKDICDHYGVELPTDAFYQAGGLDFRNDCGEAISSCVSGSLSRDQLRTISDSEAVLSSFWVSLVLAESDEDWDALQSAAIDQLLELREPEVFEFYKEQWDAAAKVIVPMVREEQLRNGVTPYTPEDYADHGPGREADAP